MQDLQGQMTQMQEKLQHIRAEGSSGGGMVTVRLNGKLEVLNISIAPEIVDPEEIGMLEDLVLAAINSAMANVQEKMKSEAAGLTGGLNIPGFPGM